MEGTKQANFFTTLRVTSTVRACGLIEANISFRQKEVPYTCVHVLGTSVRQLDYTRPGSQ